MRNKEESVLLLPLKDDNPVVHVRFQYVTVCIMVVCVLVFVWQLFLPLSDAAALLYNFGAIPGAFAGEAGTVRDTALPVFLTAISHMFVHADFMHLAGNLMFLWVFGDNIEDELGHGRFLAFYLFCGLLALLTHGLVTSDTQIPVVGASGAISGILAAYLMLHPHARVLVLAFVPFPIRMPTYIALGLWAVFNLVSGLVDIRGEDAVAWWTHIGGFAAGLIGLQLFGWRGKQSALA